MINIVTLYGDEKEVAKLREELMQKNVAAGVLDFGKLIPMPESLNITCGSATDIGIRLYLSAAAGKEWEALSPYQSEKVSDERLTELEYLYPGKMFKSEEELLKKTEHYDMERLVALGKTAVENKEQYGVETWYDWCIDHWGTKWNAYSIDDESVCEENQFRFLTAWSAPHPVIEKLAELYPSLQIMHQWADEDLGYNIGERNYQNGALQMALELGDGSETAIRCACELFQYDADEILKDEQQLS